MAIVKKVRNGIDKIEKEMTDKKTQDRLKAEIGKQLKQGKEKIEKLWEQVRDKENQEKVIAKIKSAEKKFMVYEQKAVKYTEKNPEKGLAMAAAAGLLAGTLWGTLHKGRKQH